MNEEKKYTTYTAKDITRYLNGELLPEEMHAMEKASLDDPFLAEAMEGYEGMEEKNWDKELTALAYQIAAGKRTAKIITLRRTTGRWWKAVAAILVIGSGSAITYWLTKGNVAANDKVQNIANLYPVSKSDSSVTVINSRQDTTATVDGRIADTKIKSPVGQLKDNTGIVTPSFKSATLPVAADSLFVYKPGIIKQTDLAKSDNTKSENVEEKINGRNNTAIRDELPVIQNKAVTTNEVVTVNAVPVQNDRLYEEKSKRKTVQNSNGFSKQATLNRSFIAQVVGPDNTPLPFANINIPNANFGTYADVNGNFRLVSTDTTVNVEIRSAGYLTGNYTLHSNPSIQKITLPEDVTAYNGKTQTVNKKIAGKITHSGRAALIRDSVVNVEPADGWDNYRTYVDNNLDIPADILKKDPHGEVEISFDVKSNGAIANIKVDESNCGQCAEAAKKLIKQGPQWKVTNGKKATARIKLQF